LVELELRGKPGSDIRETMQSRLPRGCICALPIVPALLEEDAMAQDWPSMRRKHSTGRQMYRLVVSESSLHS